MILSLFMENRQVLGIVPSVTFLTLSAPGREIHVLVGSEKGVSSVPGRDIHVYPGGSESDHFSLSKSASIDIFCRQISPLAAQ